MCIRDRNRLDVPVYIGESTPLRRDYVNALDTHGEDGLGESFLPEVTGYQQQISAVDFLADVLKKEKVSIIELAPMTNLARLIQKDKEAFSCIEEIVSMGGSFKSHGNCSPVAEYNYWCDPDGASLVYETLHQNGQKIHMVGLDVTRKIVLTPDLLEYMCRLNKETGEFVKKITKFYFDFHWEWEHIIGCVINDPLAVAYFINPELCKGFDSYVQIETMCIRDRYGATSMLAGNILGKTRTVSVAIASETAAGNYGMAGFWVVVILIISFVIVAAINIVSGKGMKMGLSLIHI